MKKVPTPQELEVMFSQGAPVRGRPIEYAPKLGEKLKLLFSKDFKVLVGGNEVKSTLRGRAKTLFAKEFKIKKAGALIGRGIFEADLVAMGFTKPELKHLVEIGYLSQVTVSHKGGWRNTFVFHMKVTEEEIKDAQAIPKPARRVPSRVPRNA